jgi:peroxiredoxin
MSKKTWLLWGAALAGALVITYTFAPRRGAELTPPAERMPAPDFTLTDSTGQEVSLASYKDQVVLLNFWATWCVPCRVEIPWFIEFQNKYKDRGFAVLGVDFDSHETWDIVKPYMAERKMNYTVVLAGGARLPEPYDSFDVLPTTLLIDRQGRIAALHSGLVSKSTYQDGIEELLKD